jgi:hypothetical protein
MVKVKEDLTGKVFGRLTVLEQAEDYVKPNGKREARWLCVCSCGNQNKINVIGTRLKNGRTRSCGCYRKEQNKQKFKKYNTYNLTGEYGVGLTLNTGAEFYFDLEDYDIIKDICWSEVLVGHGTRSLVGWNPNEQKNITMHQLLGYKNYDHIDRNELNNRKNNLRQCTTRDNCRNKSIRTNNSSGIIGVHWAKKSNQWRAQIGVDGKILHLGYFINKDDAIRTRLLSEQKYFGEFAPQIHLFEQYGITEQNDWKL